MYKKMKIAKYTTGDIDKVIEFFRQLPDNWDNFGSPKISTRSITAFHMFYMYLQWFFVLRHAIFAVPGGGIQVDFYYENRELSFEIFIDGSFKFEKFDKSEPKFFESGCISKDFELAMCRYNILFAWLME